MKHQWLAYVIVAVISIGAGVAIAGLPDNAPANATITPTTTDGPADTTTPATQPDTIPETAPPDTTAPETTPPETTTPPTTQPETTVPTTTEPPPGTSVPADVPDRSELFVVAANGSNVAGAAARMATRLEEIGYADVALRNGTTFSEFTAVYYAEGFEDAALRLADDLDVVDELVGSIEDAPNVTELPDDFELLVYIGLDRS